MTVGRDHRAWRSQRSARLVPCVRTPAARIARLLGSFAACVMLVGGGYGSLAFGQTTLLGGVPVLYTPSSVPAATASQNVRPQPFQRATMLDGTVKAGGGIAFSSGNPFASDPGPSSRIGDFDLLTGAYAPFAIDFAGSARGDVGWTIGRTYSQVQTTGSAQHVSDGAQGLNWFQASQPELRIIPDGVSGTLDAAQIVLGADRFIEFAQTAENAATYAAVNGAGGVLERIAADGEGEPQHYIYHQSNGTRTYFFGSGTSDNRADYQVWKIVGADGQTAYVGHPTSAATAASTGYDANRNLLLAYDGANTGAGTSATAGGRRYTYSYTGSIGGRSRLAGVVVEQRTDMTASGWSSVETVATIE
ncbi:MAG: hypothetical protein WCK74_13345, partial [Gemmatimonadaceae bacterium]